jgi:predicted HicB family RNase H-like nuclease
MKDKLRDHPVMIRLTLTEHRAWTKAAQKEGMSVSGWVRLLVRQELVK